MRDRLVWVDPASGWRYSFPAIWDPDKETMEELMDRHNYPQDLRKLPVRMWGVEDEGEKYDKDFNS